jgi:hypothetical protein
MMKLTILIVASLLLVAVIADAQEVVISGFPVGVGGSVDPGFFKPYYPELRQIANTLHENQLARAVLTGSADGEQYRTANDAKNPALALGRAHIVRDLLIREFGVDSVQIIIRTEDVKARGPEYRFVSVRVEWELAELDRRLDTLEARPPIERHFTEVQQVTNTLADNLGLQVGAGVTTSPFGGIPIITGAAAWKQLLYFELMVGHTFWNNDYDHESETLDTKRRVAGGALIVFPFDSLRLGFVGGYIRSEQLATDYQQYVRMSEGPLVGVRFAPFEYLSITGAYNPSREKVAGSSEAVSENDQFMLYVTINKLFGGGI